ncbi:hypothetical protein LEP1GSC133_5233 [Leptospira borgpetersenii serovar Pomona str. 200901868]|uniref:Uncharacterized protein n=1 Tax=Leptospira borgpetersenii serovar Pomona str. 200901868 TaxID=1192866 RepID=M6VTN1_LEPBO|nr:hypothetical protein LEP1GSC133_5233 [Leptospira borgpetersenii serovar Pomona str. 200901868]
MQLAETKKQTVLAKQTAFRRKAFCPPSSVVCPLNGVIASRVWNAVCVQRTERDGGDSTSRI